MDPFLEFFDFLIACRLGVITDSSGALGGQVSGMGAGGRDQVLGWAPSITLKEGLARTAPWIVAQVLSFQLIPPRHMCGLLL